MTSPAFTQVAFRLRNDDNDEVNATWKANQDIDANILTGVNFRVRFLIDETNNRSWSNRTWNLYYSKTGAAYAAVTDSTPVQFALSNNFADGDDTTSQLTGGSGSFLTDNNGMKEATGGATDSGASNNYFELEFCLKFDVTQFSASDTIALRIYDGTSTIAAYTSTPTIGVLRALTQTCDIQTYSETGVSLTKLAAGKKLVAAIQSYLETGVELSSLNKGYAFPVNIGEYNETGVSLTNLLTTRLVQGAIQTYSETGVSLTKLAAGRYQGTAVQTYTESGVNLIKLAAGRAVLGAVQSYVESGVSLTSLIAGRAIIAAVQSYIESGVSLTKLAAGRALITAIQTYIETGVDVTLTHGTAGVSHYTLTAIIQSYLESGVSLTKLVSGRKLSGDVQSYTVSGIDSLLSRGLLLSADIGSYSVSGVSIVPITTRNIAAVIASYILSGVQCRLRVPGVLIPSSEVLSNSGVAHVSASVESSVIIGRVERDILANSGVIKE